MHRRGTGGERTRGTGWSRHIVQLNLINKNREKERRKKTEERKEWAEMEREKKRQEGGGRDCGTNNYSLVPMFGGTVPMRRARARGTYK